MATTAAPVRQRTLADLLHDLGDIAADRVRLVPAPGTATEADVAAAYARDKSLCELVDGTLVEKSMGMPEARVASVLGHFIEDYLEANNLGMTAGADGMLRLEAGRVRIPDLLFVNWDKLPNRECPRDAIPDLAPDLAVEVLSSSNTPREMERKRREYFAAGTRLVWEVDPVERSVDVYTDPGAFTRLDESQTLDGGPVLPGFTLSIQRWFDRAARGGA
jgi:Uma2 family endonuclease